MDWSELAKQETKKAQEAGQKAAAHRQRLTSGTGQDPEYDRYMLRQHDEDRKLAEANARDFKANTKQRKWF